MARLPISTRTALALAGGVAAIAVALGLAISVLGLGRTATPSVAGPPPTFVDETVGSGLAHTYDGGFEFAVGGGVAILDCDEDGRPDVYLAGGANAATLFRNGSSVGGSLRFTAVNDPVTDIRAVNGAYPIDIDGNGHPDLVVLRNGETVLLRGLGDCTFERANERWEFDGGDVSTTAFSAKWEGDAALPTLAIGRYADLASQDPKRLCYENQLVRPVPTGSHYDVPVAMNPSWCALSMLFSDWDRSGRMDLRISNDSHYYLATDGQEQLWRVVPGEAPSEYTDADGWVRVQVEGMGIASHDLTGDGFPEVYLTTRGANRLQTLTAGPSQPTFRDIGLKLGANADRPFTGDDMTLPSTAWHDEFEDVNNDAFIDLFVAKGNVTDQPEYANQDPSNLLLGQPDGTFVEAAEKAGILSFARGRGAALVDFNLDGLLDLVEVNYGAPTVAWRNVRPGGAGADAGAADRSAAHWLALRVSQPGPNVDAIGAWIEVKVGDVTLRRELTIGGGHAGGQLGWVHFGLGPADRAEVRVQWPDGEWGPWQGVPADGFALLARGAPPVSWKPER